MSFKYQAVKITDNHYVLPKMKTMKCDAHVYLSEDLYNASEENMWTQLYESASYDGVIGAYLVPDCHTGYGIPIGGIVVTEDTIIQSGSGFDINCGVLYLKAPNLTAEDVKDWDKRRLWVDEIEKRIGFGQENAKSASKITDDVLRFGAKALGVSADVCERQYIEVSKDLDLRKLQRAYSKVQSQLGSVGGGNHFVEMQVDKDDGSVWVMIHCGSRGYGWQVANHFFAAGAELRGIPKNKKESSWLRVDEPLGREYWDYHNSAANFAIANRHTIAKHVSDATKHVFQSNLDVYYEISHNLVQEETVLLPDGTSKRGFVHRKGATRAFPKGHESLIGTKWEATGHPVLIPGSMRDGAAILFARYSHKSGFSVNHGSGRVMARGEAKRQLKEQQGDINDHMRNITREFNGTTVKGIVSNCRDIPLDECHKVYKNLDDVLNVLEAENIAKVQHRMYPVANIKGAE